MSLAVVYFSLRPVVLGTLSVDRLRFIYASFSAAHYRSLHLQTNYKDRHLSPPPDEPAVLRPDDLCKREELLSVALPDAIIRVCTEGAAAAIGAGFLLNNDGLLADIRIGGNFDDIFRRAGYNVQV